MTLRVMAEMGLYKNLRGCKPLTSTGNNHNSRGKIEGTWEGRERLSFFCRVERGGGGGGLVGGGGGGGGRGGGGWGCGWFLLVGLLFFLG